MMVTISEDGKLLPYFIPPSANAPLAGSVSRRTENSNGNRGQGHVEAEPEDVDVVAELS